jgi:hypothetical protein
VDDATGDGRRPALCTRAGRIVSCLEGGYSFLLSALGRSVVAHVKALRGRFSPHQIVSFDFLYPHTKENGVYLVEDTHTSYWPEWGGLKRPGTFMEFTKDLIDSLNAYHTRNALPVSEFTNSTTSMHFYDSVVVFEKGRMLRRHDITVGKDENGVRQRSERQSLPYQKTR